MSGRDFESMPFRPALSCIVLPVIAILVSACGQEREERTRYNTNSKDEPITSDYSYKPKPERQYEVVANDDARTISRLKRDGLVSVA